MNKMTKEKLEKVDNTTAEKTEKFPEKNVQFNEDGSITIPEVTLWNPVETLNFLRYQEKKVLSKLRESNEYVVNEVKEMLEDAFYWTWSDKYPDKENSHYEYSYSYQHDKRVSVDHPLKFLSKYQWDLSKLSDFIAQALKNRRKAWYWNTFEVLCRRFWVSENELLNMDTASIIDKMKEDIKNIPSLKISTCYNDMYERAWSGHAYIFIIKDALECLWYNLFKDY